MSDVLMTVEQVAEALRLHPKTVLRHIREGRLPAARVGKAYRIERSRLQAFTGTGPAAGQGPRATCVVDLPGTSPAMAQQLAALLGAAAVSAGASGAQPLQLSTAFDPLADNLKLVAIGAPGDVARLLELLEVQLGAQR